MPVVHPRRSPDEPRPSLGSFVSRFVLPIWRGPISRNLNGAIGMQLCLLISGTIAARLLGPQNRGYLALLTALPSAIGQLGAVGMSLAATYFLASREIGGTELVKLLRRPAALQVATLTSINVVVVLGYALISGAPIFVAASISLIQLPFAIGADYGFAFLLGSRKHGRVNTLRLLSPGIYAAAVAVLYVLHVRTLVAAVTCLVASVVVAAVIVTLAGLHSLTGVRSSDSLVARLGPREARRHLLRFGRQGYFGYLSPVDAFRIDQLAVGFLLTPRALGFYVVGAAFTNFARLVALNIGLSSTPEIAAHATPQQRWLAVRRMLLLSAEILVIVNVVLAATVPFILPVLFGDQFRSSIPVAEVLLLSGSILAIKRVAVDAMRGAGEAQVGTHAELLSLAVFLVACAPFALWLGGPGVALALLLGATSGSAVLIRKLRRFDAEAFRPATGV